MGNCCARHVKGLTLIELLVVVSVSVALLAIAAPSMWQMIATQRLKSINAELVTDLQYARSTAISRNTEMRLHFGRSVSGDMTCYVIFVPTFTGSCDCSRAPGTACWDGNEEIRTAQIPSSTDVKVEVSSTSPTSIGDLAFTPDGMRNVGTNYVLSASRISGAPGLFLTTINATGRPSVCFSGSAGATSC